MTNQLRLRFNLSEAVRARHPEFFDHVDVRDCNQSAFNDKGVLEATMLETRSTFFDYDKAS